MKEPNTWTLADENLLDAMKREYRRLRAMHKRFLEIHRLGLEKWGREYVALLDPETRAGLAGLEEGHPETRAMGQVIRRLEAVKRELLRPGGPDEEALDRARRQLSEACEVLEQYRPGDNSEEPEGGGK